MKEIRVEVKIKNNMIYEAIYPIFGSISKFCKATGLNNSKVGALINLRASPMWNGYTKTARKLAEICGYSCEELYPMEMYRNLIKEKIVKTISLNSALIYEENRRIASGEINESIDIRGMCIKSEVRKVINTLSPKQYYTIRRRFGIGDNIERTLEEVAEDMSLSRERVRQIEAKAIRILRHPSRSKSLRII